MSELKQIKRHHEQQLNNMDKKLTMYQIHPDDVSWLIEQAERTIDYDNNLISLEDNKQYVSELIKQNKRYRKALEAIYELVEYNEYDNTLEQIVEEVEKALEGKK